jgi:hypothetical protein
MNKQEWVLSQFKRGRTLSPVTAMAGCGTMRLAAIVFDLRGLGYDILTIPVKGSNGVNYATYKMVKKGKK